MRVLIVRPAPGSRTTADAVTAMGLEPVVVPLFEVAPQVWEAPEPNSFDAVVMTSANAARHGGEGLARFAQLPVFAVGEATGDAARAAGFGNVLVGNGDAAALGPRLAGRVVHFTGTDHQPIPTDAEVTTIPVYRSRALHPAALPRADIALVHSSRAGTRLAELATDDAFDRAAVQIVAISAAAARACGTGWAAVHIAEHPREHAMLACLARVCEATVKH